MIKVFLVEDEVIIRESVKNSIDWKKKVMNLQERQVMGNLPFL